MLNCIDKSSLKLFLLDVVPGRFNRRDLAFIECSSIRLRKSKEHRSVDVLALHLLRLNFLKSLLLQCSNLFDELFTQSGRL